jgi:DNA end-binding protein Ku
MASTIWKGRLNFGLVSIPIKLSRAARAEKIHMHKLQRETGTRVRQVFVPTESDTRWNHQHPSKEQSPQLPATPQPTHGRGNDGMTAPVVPAAASMAPPVDRPQETGTRSPGLSSEDIVHGFEYEKDRYVQFEPEELAKIAPRSSPDMQILEFVRFAEIDPVYLETSYYVAPDAGGDKPYALLFETLKKTGYAAVGEFVMHRRDQIMVLRPGDRGLIAHTLFYGDEVKRENEYLVGSGVVPAKEMDLAVKLVEALAAKFEPEKFKDQYRERLLQAISQKVESGAVTQSESQAPQKPVVDIMAALQESLTRIKKPVASESRSRPATTKRTKRAGER